MKKKNYHISALVTVLAFLAAALAFGMGQLSMKVNDLESTVSDLQNTIAEMQETTSETSITDIEQHLTALDSMVIAHISEEYQGDRDFGSDNQELEYNQDFEYNEELLYEVPGYSANACCGDGLEHVISQYNEREIAYALNTVGKFSAYCQEHDFTVEILPYYCG